MILILHTKQASLMQEPNNTKGYLYYLSNHDCILVIAKAIFIKSKRSLHRFTAIFFAPPVFDALQA
jgi:hypothetical protein